MHTFMNKAITMKLAALFIFDISCSQLLAQPCGQRYLNNIFPPVTTSTLPFDIQANYLSAADPLNTYIIATFGYTESKRAAIIFIHGGGFVGGNRAHHDLVLESGARKLFLTIGLWLFALIPNSSFQHFLIPL